jgi:hypothetical protein
MKNQQRCCIYLFLRSNGHRHRPFRVCLLCKKQKRRIHADNKKREQQKNKNSSITIIGIFVGREYFGEETGEKKNIKQ